ncbi:MAG: hypothetical protein U1F43_39270 [Myxococcota bacterium]
MTADDPTPERTAETPVKDPHLCPVCSNPVDPRKTTQALHRNGRLMLFCTSGCLREFMRTERDAKG